VPGIFVGGNAPSSSVDRCHALASLPNSTMPACAITNYELSIVNYGKSMETVAGAMINRPVVRRCDLCLSAVNPNHVSGG